MKNSSGKRRSVSLIKVFFIKKIHEYIHYYKAESVAADWGPHGNEGRNAENPWPYTYYRIQCCIPGIEYQTLFTPLVHRWNFSPPINSGTILRTQSFPNSLSINAHFFTAHFGTTVRIFHHRCCYHRAEKKFLLLWTEIRTLLTLHSNNTKTEDFLHGTIQMNNSRKTAKFQWLFEARENFAHHFSPPFTTTF